MRIIAHRPDKRTVEDEYDRKEKQAREDHSLDQGEPVVFLEVAQGDASEFTDDLEVDGDEVGRHRILRCTSAAVPNAIAALLIHVRDRTGRIPDAYFGWTEGEPARLRPALPGPRRGRHRAGDARGPAQEPSRTRSSGHASTSGDARRPPRVRRRWARSALAAFALFAFTPLTGAHQPAARRRARAAARRRHRRARAPGCCADGELTDHSLRRHRGRHPPLPSRARAAPDASWARATGAPVEAEVRAALARDLGVPADALVVERAAGSRRARGAAAAGACASSGGRRILLVTGAQHMPARAASSSATGSRWCPAPVIEDLAARARVRDGRLELARAHHPGGDRPRCTTAWPGPSERGGATTSCCLVGADVARSSA